MTEKNITIIGTESDNNLLQNININKKDFIISSASSNDSIKLSYKNSDIAEYHKEYYKLSELKSGNNEDNNYNQKIDKFCNSDYLIIVIDNSTFKNESAEEIKKGLKRNYVRTINQYMSQYSAKHDGNVLPIIFVIERSSDYNSKYTNSEITEIIGDTFNVIFNDETKKYILYTDKMSGSAIPLLLCIEDTLFKTRQNMQFELEHQKSVAELKIKDNTDFLVMHNTRVMKFLSSEQARKAETEITNLNNDIQNKITHYDNHIIHEEIRIFKSVIEDELRQHHTSPIYGFDDYNYQLIENDTQSESTTDTDEGTYFLLMCAVLLISVIAGIWIPKISLSLLLLVQLYFLGKGKKIYSFFITIGSLFVFIFQGSGVLAGILFVISLLLAVMSVFSNKNSKE